MQDDIWAGLSSLLQLLEFWAGTAEVQSSEAEAETVVEDDRIILGGCWMYSLHEGFLPDTSLDLSPAAPILLKSATE